jgi:hypothetical protein
MARLWLRALFLSATTAAVIALVVIATAKPPSANSYGVAARYRGRTLEYPDLCLRFIGAHDTDDRRHTHYDFDILDRSGREKREPFCYIVSGSQPTQFFRFRGHLYVTEMAFTEPPGGWIDGDVLSLAEITVWDEDSAEVSNPELIKDARYFDALDAKPSANRKPNQRPEGTPGNASPSNQSLVPGVPHP